MSILTIFITALGLSMDALAVSVSSGMAVVPLRQLHALKMALFFGVFQALMPVFGYVLGMTFKDSISAFDHWIAFGLLSFIGGKLIYDSFLKEGEDRPATNPFATGTLVVLATATSIDALAVGLSFSLLEVPMFIAVLMIGAVTSLVCYPAVWLGSRLGRMFSKRAQLAGGLTLIGIGLKILVEHLL